MEEQRKHKGLYKGRVAVGKGKVGLFRSETGVHLLLSKYFPGVKYVGGLPGTGEVVIKAVSSEALDAAVRYIQEDFVDAALTEHKKAYTRGQAHQLRQNGHAKLDRIFKATSAWLYLDSQDVLHILGTADEVQEAARQVDQVLQSHVQLPLQGVAVGAILGPMKDVKSRSSGTKIWLDKQKKIITISGPHQEVSKAAGELKTKLRDLRARAGQGKRKEAEAEDEEEEADDRQDDVDEEKGDEEKDDDVDDGDVGWTWQDDDGTWCRYDQKTERTLESLHNHSYVALRGSSSVVHTFRVESYEYAICLDEHGNYKQINLTTKKVRAVKRKDLLASDEKEKARGSSKPPIYWKPHHPDPNEAKFHVLSPTSDLHHQVRRKFHKDPKNGRFEVVKVEFVQCPRRWKAYANNRKLYVESGGRTDIKWERNLWHGTAAENTPKISAQGFLRQFGERQAYGNGVYFAVSSHYSSNSAYSVPDAQGLQRMFLARVLVGEPYPGKEGMKLPPSKSSDGLHTYDSLVDSASNPSIYVICNDDHAYAEFVVTFRAKATRQPVASTPSHSHSHGHSHSGGSSVPLTSGPSTPTYTSSWQPYVDTNLVNTGAVTQAAILGHDGRTWASSAGFVVTPAQGRTLANAFSNPGSIRSGFDLDRFHYDTLRADNRSIYGRTVSGGVIAVRTTQAILIGIHNEKIQLGTAANVVEKLADYLIGQGY